MLAFLQGFALGLFVSCGPWFLAGLINPALAVPAEPAGRLQVILRYWLAIPFIAFVLWLTSLWGGFGPGFLGWIAGLLAVAVELPLERCWRRWRAGRRDREQRARAERSRAARAASEREAGVTELDPAHPPADADALVDALCRVKQRLLDARRADLAGHADRLYTRYRRALELLRRRFDAREVTGERALELLRAVGHNGVDELESMASRAAGVLGVDAQYVQRRLRAEGDTLTAEERRALERRLQLVDDTEAELRRRAGRLETVMTALDDAVVALAGIETGRGHASVTADRALADLQRFVQGAERYQRTTESTRE
ncbi:cobyrinic acid a,c-diamide synthase [Aquisalimonas lutea]|uniref:cobyrinic acid a,c-diamide synthase n=1 Tax=Aquisalimonas lutea TaxID=1327750 RepID=UPI0025B3675B|nr:cobyrinic acid a,c-diamide synthase [Aquisalimonas lutea]MDN3518008.1 cobyrinic acid a,c-diamide synthase [Aquisalimonas lutea]